MASLKPPRQFLHSNFKNYLPYPDFPSQARTRDYLERFIASLNQPPYLRPKKSWFSRTKSSENSAPLKAGVYLDGGFGVGKTHLLAASSHAFGGVSLYGTFMQYTALVGLLGYVKARDSLARSRLICIDEFELDDPGDAMIMTRLLRELIAGGARVIATSNTPPNALGKGRFGADKFLREISDMASHFEIMRIDGFDYRQREISAKPRALSNEAIDRGLVRLNHPYADDEFGRVIDHLTTVHPSNYAWLLDGINLMVWRDIAELDRQDQALLLVAFVDRVYDAQIPVAGSGASFSDIFPEEMLEGGYRKKYLRTISRLAALSAAADKLLGETDRP